MSADSCGPQTYRGHFAGGSRLSPRSGRGEIQSHGCPVMLCAPFTEQLRNLGSLELVA
jgi:hypothetical protein